MLKPHHDIIVGIPRQARLDDHGSGNQRRKQCSKRVARVQKPLNRIRFIHGTNPCAETCVCQAISKAADGIAHNKSWIRRVSGEDGKRYEMAYGRHDGHTPLAE